MPKRLVLGNEEMKYSNKNAQLVPGIHEKNSIQATTLKRSSGL
ncbi:hypothetical protein SAMN04488122_0927 [Chitinophaga arvensicola]|uniref:Uncharacterized protein n=1 Tax=Chitinophaga arvensicola TaxID=29529 RepID=A0A1I0PRF8_9BACT|nr:hypothetical protein SAMN04488122_0927 [Chitinophaga arvensicola]